MGEKHQIIRIKEQLFKVQQFWQIINSLSSGNIFKRNNMKLPSVINLNILTWIDRWMLKC